MATHKCDACDGLCISYGQISDDERWTLASGAFGEPTSADEHHFIDRSNRLTWLPPASGRELLEHAPTEIAATAAEAQKCAAFESYRAAVQLARSVVEATAKNKGIVSGNIKAKIDTMFERRLIREHIRDGAHEVRFLGNEMAHGDFTAPVTAEDAMLVLGLMHEVLVEVYESPGRLRQVQERRTGRTGTE